jgi:hypothetical protein
MLARVARGVRFLTISERHFPYSAEEMGFPPGTVIALPARKGQTLFRLIREDEPQPKDFLSYRDRGKPRYKGDEELPELLMRGISMFASPGRAERTARYFPKRIARVTMWEGLGVSIAKTRGPGHYTVWGDPEVLVTRARLDVKREKP